MIKIIKPNYEEHSKSFGDYIGALTEDYNKRLKAHKEEHKDLPHTHKTMGNGVEMVGGKYTPLPKITKL